jgi:citrate lyase subunit beta / citryl-CoA lyase
LARAAVLCADDAAVSGPCSYLFVPADRPERFAKALASGAGAVIVDLEDAVAPGAKEAAREALSQWLTSESALTSSTPLLVRINAACTECFHRDLALLCQAPRGVVSGVVVPKAESAAVLEQVHHRCQGLPTLPLVETATGFDRLKLLTRAAGVQRLVFGSIDFQLDLGIEEGEVGVELLFFRSQLVLASRLARLPAPVDGVTATLDDPARTERAAQAARRLGFGGKLCIHPRQVAAVHAAFAPSQADIAWARRVLQAAEQSGGAAVAVDGRMVDKPVERQAARILGLAT